MYFSSRLGNVQIQCIQLNRNFGEAHEKIRATQSSTCSHRRVPFLFSALRKWLTRTRNEIQLSVHPVRHVQPDDFRDTRERSRTCPVCGFQTRRRRQRLYLGNSDLVFVLFIFFIHILVENACVTSVQHTWRRAGAYEESRQASLLTMARAWQRKMAVIFAQCAKYQLRETRYFAKSTLSYILSFCCFYFFHSISWKYFHTLCKYTIYDGIKINISVWYYEWFNRG